MIPLAAFRLLCIIFFGSVTLIGRAQNDFFQFDTNFPSRTLFPFVDGTVFNIKDLVDDGSIQRVVTILQSNIKQWSFIESQLLEPNVHLGMPEIFIPLRHLTTTLEVLGNILFMRDDIQEARSSLERACPLMELLPASVNEDHRFAVGCFALLREVYGKLYSIRDGGDRELLGIDSDGNDDNDVYSGAADDDIDLGRDVDKDRGRYDDDEDDSGRRRGRRRRRKRGKLHNYSQSLSPTNSGGQGSGLFDADRDDNEDFVLHTSLDIDRRFEDLRSPYDHLRAELHLQQLQENHQPAPQIMYREGSGLATATADLDALVQRFVYEDNVGRLKLFRMAKEYHEAMTVHMTANPQLVNGLGRDLDIVLVYVDVLSRVNTEGSFDFISKELDSFNLAASSRGNERALGLEDCSENGEAADDFDEDEDDDDDDYDDQEEEEHVDRLSKDEDPVSESENDPSDDPDGTEEPPETADILSGRLGGRDSDSSRVKGRSISGAGRIRRHSSVAGSITELLKSQQQQSLRVPGTEKPKQKNGKVSSKKSTKSIVLQADSASRSTIQRLFESKAPKGSIDNLESATIGGKYRSTPLTPAERNRFLVLNAFERALSDHHNPSLQCSDNDNEKSPGVIYGNGRDGRKREKSGRDRWSYHNYERDRESASKIFESFVDDDKLRVHSESVTSILLTLSTFLVVIILRAIFLTTRTRSKILLEQGTGQCKGRYIKARTYGEYFLSQVPLPVTLVAVIGSILGIQSSRGMSCAVEDAAASSNIDDLSPNNQSKNKKDSKRSGRGDYRERDSHRLLPAISLDISTVKEGEPRGFFNELQSVMISIWKELSSTVASSPTVQIHAVASNPPVKAKGTPAVVTAPQGIIPPTNSCPTLPVPTAANPCTVTSPVNKLQQQMKVPSSKKDKALANGKAKVGGHSATDSSVKKIQPSNSVKVKTQVTVPICVPVRTPCPTDDTSSRDSDGDSDADSAVRSGDIPSASKTLVRNLSATPVDPTDDDAGYSRYVRKGSVNAAKSAAAAASSRTVELIVPKPSQLSNSLAITSLAQRNAAAMSMAPIVDAATVAQQRAALLYYETLKEKERVRLLSVAKGQQSSPSVPPQQATGTGLAAWSTVSRLSTPPTTSKTNISVPLNSSSSLKSANAAVVGVTPKGSTSSHSFASAVPKSITYASVAQNISTSASSGLHEHSTRSSLSSIGSSASSHSVRASFTSTVAPSKDATSSNPHSANNSCPSSPGGSLSKRRGGGVGKDNNSSSKASKNAKGCGNDLSPAQIEEHHNAYLRAREQASDQLQQLQLMSDLRSLSVRPAEGITSTTFIPEPFVTEGYHVQSQTSRSLSSSFDGSRSQIQSQFGGLVGFLTESEKEREAGRERALLATYTLDTIGDMDIGTIDLSFALANDVDGDNEPDKSMTSSNIESLYGSNGSQQHSLMQGQGQGGYDYMGLSQYSTHATQDEQLNSENNVHNYYLATGDVDGIVPQSYSQSPYSYGDYKPSSVPTEDLDRSIPRPRGFSSGSQLDLTAQSLSGLSPNAPSFNPNTMAAWRGLPAITQPSQVNPFDQSLIQQPPHNIGLMDSELSIDYAANLDYTVQMQLQLQHQHLYFQENTSSMQGYEGRFSQFMSVNHPSQQLQLQQQQQQHPLSMFYKQEGEPSHQSLAAQHNLAINSCLPNPPGISSTSTSTFAAVPATFQYSKTSVSETEKSTTPEP